MSFVSYERGTFIYTYLTNIRAQKTAPIGFKHLGCGSPSGIGWLLMMFEQRATIIHESLWNKSECCRRRAPLWQATSLKKKRSWLFILDEKKFIFSNKGHKHTKLSQEVLGEEIYFQRCEYNCRCPVFYPRRIV